MAPFDVVAAEKFMRAHSIIALNIHLSNSEVYHCWIGPTDNKFRYHANTTKDIR